MSIKKEVEEWVAGYEYEDEKGALLDIQSSGCVSGLVPDLIHYRDTLAFFERNKEEINKLLKEQGDESGVHVLPLLKGYDDEDPLCLETTNQNLLAWYGFEEVARKLYTEKYEE